MNEFGWLVDPPPNAVEFFRANGISTKCIRGVILTHTHADHDAGTFQRMLQEGRMVLITTSTVRNSFMTKYTGEFMVNLSPYLFPTINNANRK